MNHRGKPRRGHEDMWEVAKAMLALQRQETATGSSIVEIQPRGRRPPLFLVHGVGGGMLWGYSNLARQLGEEQPIYAFKSRGLDRMEEFTRIEDMAAHYLAISNPPGCAAAAQLFQMARRMGSKEKQSISIKSNRRQSCGE